MTEIAKFPASVNRTEVEPLESGSSMQQSRVFWGWVFIAPWIIGFLVFLFIPMIASLAFTFTDFQLNQPDEIEFIGLKNYVDVFEDPVMRTSIRTTLIFMALALPMSIALPIALAMMLNAKSLLGKTIFRTLFYMPFIIPTVSAVGIWEGFLNTQSGWLNRLLRELGLYAPDWMNSATWIYPALLLIGVWATGNAMLVTLAGLQGVPTELYEAAEVDGAGPWKQFRHITLPMISPVIFYNLILTTVGLFRYFDIPYMLKQGSGDPANSTLFLNIYLYKNAFTFQDMGYGATIAWVLFAIAMVVTVFLFATGRYWVYSSGGDNR